MSAPREPGPRSHEIVAREAGAVGRDPSEVKILTLLMTCPDPSDEGAVNAMRRGLAGFVIDGAIRDLDVIGAGALPVFAAGVTHRGPYKDGPGEINAPIAIDGMVIHPGDLIIGDADGVLCVPCDEACSSCCCPSSRGRFWKPSPAGTWARG